MNGDVSTDRMSENIRQRRQLCAARTKTRHSPAAPELPAPVRASRAFWACHFETSVDKPRVRRRSIRRQNLLDARPVQFEPLARDAPIFLPAVFSINGPVPA